MKKSVSITILLLLSLYGSAQSLNGIYKALEVISLDIDTSGQISFYRDEHYPKEKWFHEVVLTIRGAKFSVEKSPVYFDSLGKKKYSASDGGFLTYLGIIKKSGQLFIASTDLAGYEYVGISFFKPPKQLNDEDSLGSETALPNNKMPSPTELSKKYDVLGDSDGNWTYFPKGTIKKDFIIRPDKNGIWVNNVFYYKVKP